MGTPPMNSLDGSSVHFIGTVPNNPSSLSSDDQATYDTNSTRSSSLTSDSSGLTSLSGHDVGILRGSGPRDRPFAFVPGHGSCCCIHCRSAAGALRPGLISII